MKETSLLIAINSNPDSDCFFSVSYEVTAWQHPYYTLISQSIAY